MKLLHTHLTPCFTVAALVALSAAPLQAQLTWRKAGDAPAARLGHQAFFDAARGRVTVFGGQDSPSTRATDCWQFDGSAWMQMDLPPTPGRAYGAAAKTPLLASA